MTFWDICWNLPGVGFPLDLTALSDCWNDAGARGAGGDGVEGVEGEKVVWNLGLEAGVAEGKLEAGEGVGALWPNLGPVLLSDNSIKICC